MRFWFTWILWSSRKHNTCTGYSKEMSFSELGVHSVQQWIFERTACEDQHFCHSVAVPSFLQNCYSQVTILIHCPSADKSDGRRHNCYIKGRRALPMSMYSLNRALLLLSPSAPLSFFLKNNILILFSSKEKKNSEHSKMVTREQNDNFCTFVLIECNYFFCSL